MEIKINLNDEHLRVGQPFVLAISLKNEAPVEKKLAVKQFLANAERVALRIIDEAGTRLEPVEYKVVVPIRIPEDRVLAPGEEVLAEMTGKVLEKAPNVFALEFPRATYRLDFGKKYTCTLHWGEIETEPIQFGL